MRNRMALVASAILLGTSASATGTAHSPLDLAIERYEQAQVSGDRTALEALLADDYLLVTGGGDREDKSAFIGDLTASDFKLEPYVIQAPVRRVWKDGAVVAGIARQKGTSGGKPFDGCIRYADTWKATRKGWQVAFTHVARMAAPVPTDACKALPDRHMVYRSQEAEMKRVHEIVSGEVPYVADGLEMMGHLARPRDEGPWPAALIAHDGVGLDDYQRSRADDLASRGYIAFALDFHGGETFFRRPQEMLERTMPLLADPGRIRTVGRAALDILLATPGVDQNEVVALGYGAGGRIVIELVKTGAAFRSAALVHPALPEPDAEDWLGSCGAVLLATGSDDPIVPPDHLVAFGQALRKWTSDWRIVILGGAQHAFWSRPTNPDGSPADGQEHVQTTVPGVGYHPLHAERYWRSVVDLFDGAQCRDT